MSPRERGYEEAWRQTTPRRLDDRTVMRRAARMRRRAAAQRVVELAVPLAGIVLILAALHHAANPLERALGIAVAVATIAASAMYFMIRRNEQRAVVASAPEFLSAVLHNRRRERTLAVFVLATIALELTFLVPWWDGGIRRHAGDYASAVVIWTLWIPAAVMLLIAIWAVRLYRRASRELQSVESVASEFRDA
jgi:hypothetical protein